MHSLYWGRIPVNFNQFFPAVSQGHSHATRAATRGEYLWKLASTIRGKRSLKGLGSTSGTPLILPYVTFQTPAFKKQFKGRPVKAYSD